MPSKEKTYSKRIFLGYDQDGNQVRKRITAKSEKELAKLEFKIREEYKKTSGKDCTLGVYYDRWLSTYKANASTGTLAMYENIKVLMTKSHIDLLPIKSITPTDLQGFINDNISKPNTCNKIRMTLRQIFRHAVQDRIIETDPTPLLVIPKYEKKRPEDKRKLTAEELAAIKEAPLGRMDRIYLDLMYYLGLRPEECRALTPASFDLTSGTVHIRSAIIFKVNQPELKDPKTYKGIRDLPIPTAFMPELKAYLKDLRSEYLIHNLGHLAGEADDQLEGPIQTKEGYVRQWQRIKEALCKQLYEKVTPENMQNFKNFTAYCFRREYATNLCYMVKDQKITIKKAAQLMGHADTKLLYDVYASIDEAREDLSALKDLQM